MDGYTRGEVAWLLGLTREEAILQDACQADSLAHLADEDASDSHTATQEWDPVMTVARWDDVHRARTRVLAQRLLDDGLSVDEVRMELVIAYLRAWGIGEYDVARLVGIDRYAARRRFSGLLRYVLDELGGEKARDEAMLERRADACMRCAARPRIRWEKKVRKMVDGRKTTVRVERQTSLCAECLLQAPPMRGSAKRPGTTGKGGRMGTMRELLVHKVSAPEVESGDGDSPVPAPDES